MKVQLKNVRLSFPHLFAAQASEMGKPKYSATFIFEPGSANEKVMLEAIEQVGKEKWGPKWPAVKKSLTAGLKICLKDGDMKSQYAGFEGNMFVAASNVKRPLVVDRDASPLTEADGKPYGGCYVNASIDIWAQDHAQYGQRINASLLGVQFVKDGESFGGGLSASTDDFEPLEVEDADDLV